ERRGPGGGQDRVPEDIGGGALQRWLGPNSSADQSVDADARSLLSDAARLRGADREGVAQFRAQVRPTAGTRRGQVVGRQPLTGLSPVARLCVADDAPVSDRL